MSWLSEFVRRFFPRQDGRQSDENLDVDNSVVDLMKSRGMNSSYEARKKLAIELGRPGYTGTAEDNIWLHGKIKNR